MATPRKPTRGPLDKNDVEAHWKSVPRESRADREARIEAEKAEAAHQRRKDFLLFVTGNTLVVVVALTCALLVLIPGVSADNRKDALALLAVIVSAFVGYLTGKSSK